MTPFKRHSVFRIASASVLGATALCFLCAAPAPAQTAQTAAEAYERAQEQEREALANSTPSAESFRKVARAYEAIAYRFPVSGYSDNALWQAAEMFERAFGISGLDRDRDAVGKELAWLQKEYPHSPFVKQAAARTAAAAQGLAATTAVETAPAGPDSPSQSRVPTSQLVFVKGITQAQLPRGDRIIIELSGEASYNGERVSNPDRVFFDFTNAATASSVVERIRAFKSPLVKGIRVGVPSKGVARVVLELVGEPRFSSFPMYGPFRLVVDIEATAQPANGAPAPAATSQSPALEAAVPHTQAQPPAATPAQNMPVKPSVKDVAPSPAPAASTQKGDYSLARQLGLRVARVVIDPGHGGHDPGAQSNGVTEAELVLDVALRLEKLLSQQPGVEVVLTRRTNEFIPLEERTAIANRENADLFLSIHANAHRHSAVRGIETYFLSFAMNEEAEAVAARENATSAQTMGTLPAIVKAIALNNKLMESRELASLVQTAMVRRLRTQSAGVKDHGVKQAPFVVLIGAQMPSVLTEIAFLTNKPEAGLLKQPAYRQQIAQAIKDGVVRYQDSLKKVVTVATRERDPGR
jgi:N-acetylmuramoyl-L-alanine amidase